MLENPRDFVRKEQRFKVVPIKSLGDSVRLRSITGSEFLALRMLDDLEQRMKFLLVRMVVNSEGFGILTEDYVIELLSGDGAVASELFEECQRHAFDHSSVGDVKKN